MTRTFRAMRRISDLHRRTVASVAVVTLLVAVVTPVVANAAEECPIASFLPRAGEIGAFEPGKAQIFRTVGMVREGSGARPAKSTVRRYEAEGFVEAAIVRIHDQAEPAAEGISSVFEFETPTGASAEMKAEKEQLAKDLSPGTLPAGRHYVALRHFKVPGVSKAVGLALLPSNAALRLGAESGIAKGLFVEGNCLFAVGLFRPWSKEVIGPIRAGVQAISGRAAGTCP